LIEINIYEKMFIDILNGKCSIDTFENWIYENEALLTKEQPVGIYNELILLNYKTKESKQDLANALNIDYEKLELYEIQDLLTKELQRDPILNSIKYEVDFYDLDFLSFDFNIGTLKFRMHCPFKFQNFTNIAKEEKVKIFSEKFGNEKKFLECLRQSIGSDNFRIYNWKKHEQTDIMTTTKLIQTKDDEYKIKINGHSCYIKKEYLNNKMKNAWL
jgi:hypothetical protein